MGLSKNITDREFDKFTENSDNKTAVRVIITNPKPEDQPPPTNLKINNSLTASVKEGLADGAFVGTLTIQEGSGTAPLTYTIVQDLSNAFQIVNDELQTSRTLVHDNENQVNVTVRCNDSNS